MSTEGRSSLYGGLFGLLVGVVSEAIRFGLGERRSLSDMAVMVATMIVIGVVAPRLRNSSTGNSEVGDEQPDSHRP